jgi:hypothetical protein
VPEALKVANSSLPCKTHPETHGEMKMRKALIAAIVGVGLLAGCTGQEVKDTLNSFEWGKPQIVVNPNAEEEALTEYLCDQYGNCT